MLTPHPPLNPSSLRPQPGTVHADNCKSAFVSGSANRPGMSCSEQQSKQPCVPPPCLQKAQEQCQAKAEEVCLPPCQDPSVHTGSCLGLPRYSRTWSVSLKTVLSVFHHPLWISIVLGGLVGGLNCGNRVLIRGDPGSLVQLPWGKKPPIPGWATAKDASVHLRVPASH